jgi:hypothetical protein
MNRYTLAAGLTIAVLALANPAGAQFLAADLLYIPGVAHTDGEGSSQWRSDVFITNVETEANVDVAIVYLETGLISNAEEFIDRSTWLGGTEGDGFGQVDPALANIPPGGTVVLEDPIGTYWPNAQGTANYGALVIFAYESGSLESDGTRVYENVIVNSRVYTPTTFYQPDPENEGEFLEVKGTYGQTLPGVPWYNLADPSAVSDDANFSFQILSGAAADTDYRYNVGILNASDPLTTITLLLQPFKGDGEPFLDDNDNPIVKTVTMPPVSQVQYNNILTSLFGLEDVPNDTTIDVAFISWASANSQPVVGMTIYGTMIDNQTNDPTAILPAFAYPYNIDCQWPSSGGTKSSFGGIRRVSDRPLEIPPR